MTTFNINKVPRRVERNIRKFGIEAQSRLTSLAAQHWPISHATIERHFDIPLGTLNLLGIKPIGGKQFKLGTQRMVQTLQRVETHRQISRIVQTEVERLTKKGGIREIEGRIREVLGQNHSLLTTPAINRGLLLAAITRGRKPVSGDKLLKIFNANKVVKRLGLELKASGFNGFLTANLRNLIPITVTARLSPRKRKTP
ncbi:MAG: hypothetical protein ABH863_02465 [Candidatus Micrarchaeota archaeon]